MQMIYSKKQVLGIECAKYLRQILSAAPFHSFSDRKIRPSRSDFDKLPEILIDLGIIPRIDEFHSLASMKDFLQLYNPFEAIEAFGYHLAYLEFAFLNPIVVLSANSSACDDPSNEQFTIMHDSCGDVKIWRDSPTEYVLLRKDVLGSKLEVIIEALYDEGAVVSDALWSVTYCGLLYSLVLWWLHDKGICIEPTTTPEADQEAVDDIEPENENAEPGGCEDNQDSDNESSEESDEKSDNERWRELLDLAKNPALSWGDLTLKAGLAYNMRNRDNVRSKILRFAKKEGVSIPARTSGPSHTPRSHPITPSHIKKV